MGYLLAALLGGFLTFNSVATPDRAERMVEDVLHEQFPGAQVDVDIKGKRGRNVLKGRFSKVDVSLQNIASQEGGMSSFAISAVPDAKNKGKLGETTIQLRDIVWDGVAIELIELKVRDLIYDFDALKNDNELKIISSGPVSTRLTIPAAAVEHLVRKQLTSVQDARLSFQNDRLILKGGMPLPMVKAAVPFTLTAKLEPRNSNEIWMIDPKLALQNAPGLGMPAGPLLGRVNPLIVVDKEKKWPYHVNIKEVQTREGKLDIRADLSFLPVFKK